MNQQQNVDSKKNIPLNYKLWSKFLLSEIWERENNVFKMVLSTNGESPRTCQRDYLKIVYRLTAKIIAEIKKKKKPTNKNTSRQNNLQFVWWWVSFVFKRGARGGALTTVSGWRFHLVSDNHSLSPLPRNKSHSSSVVCIWNWFF